MWDPFEIHTNLNRSKTSKTLDWDETAADIGTDIEGIHDTDRRVFGLKWLYITILVVFLLLGGRIFYLQIIKGPVFRGFSDSNRVRSETILAPRGLILDRNGNALAQNSASFNLVAIPFDLPKNGVELDAEISQAATVFNFDKTQLEQQLKDAGSGSLDPIVAEQGISQQQEILFQTQASNFIGFSIQQVPIRQYIDSDVFADVLGYTGLVSQYDLLNLDPTKYATVDYTGKSGIEAEYENYLHGANGQDLIEVDATGKLLDVLGQNDPVPGDSLDLNIDAGLQEEIYNELESDSKTNPRAAAVAMDPRNGQILALVSLPGFDNNLFAQGIKPSDYLALLNDKNLPLFNRAIAGTYPPGSTVKPMVGLAGLQEGIITDSTIIDDHGDLVIPNEYDPSIKYNFYGWTHTGLGPINLYEAIAQSDDIYFYTVAGGYPNSAVPQGLGVETLASYFHKFNLGSPTGIDLPGEQSGLVPTPEWKAQFYKNDPVLSKWYLGDTYHMGIGQGDVLVTPLQMTEWISAIANNGVGYVPQILNKVVDSNGDTVYQNQPKILINKFIDDKYLKIMQQALRDTVTVGSGRELDKLSVEAAGKSGTSQFDDSDLTQTHAWFTAYAPFQDPQIVVTVLVEAGGEGNVIAEPVVRDAIAYWAKNIYKKSN